jgi:Icc-related predicted phosphoesterase
MRICLASDLHGSRTLYDQLGELLRRERPEVAILGGDLLPDGEAHDPDGTQAAWVRAAFAFWIDEVRRAVPGLPMACCMGNHDWLRSELAMRAEQEAGRLVLLEMQRVWHYQGVNFVGCPFSPPSPHFAKDYERLDTAEDRLPDFDCAVLATGNDGIHALTVAEHFAQRPTLEAELAAIATPDEPWILVAHAPPYDTKLDRLPNLDSPIGSKAVRRFIEARRPLCALHGHVHESPHVSGAYYDHVGGVLCINPGQGHEKLHAALFDTEQPRATLRHTVLA